MSHLLDSQEGHHSTRQNDEVSEDVDAATSKWLKLNKLGHLIAVFGDENITIDELMDMDSNELESFLDELVKDDSVPKFKQRDKIRIKSKLKSKQNNNNNNNNKQQAKPQRVIVTEAETTALNSLDIKYNELTSQKKSIEDRLSEFEAEYIKQEKILNSSFDEIVSNIAKRRNILLNEMKQKGDEYKNKLSQRMKSVANQRSVLSKIKNKCEQTINNSAISSLQAAQKRANKTVTLIDETLLSVQQNHNFSNINNNINVQFNISKSKINNHVKQWGAVTIIGDKPPPPKINFVTVLYNRMTIELLSDENCKDVVSKYQINISPEVATLNQNNNQFDVSRYIQQQQQQPSSSFVKKRSKSNTKLSKSSQYKQSPNKYNNDIDEKDTEENDEYTMKEITNDNDQNIAFYSFDGLSQNTEYKVRGRALFKDGQKGEWSVWSVVVTPKPYIPKQRRYQVPFQNKEYLNMDEWFEFCYQHNVWAWSSHQQQRIFYYAKFLNDESYAQRMNNMNNMELMDDIPHDMDDMDDMNMNNMNNMKNIIRPSGSIKVDGFRSFLYQRLYASEWKQIQQAMRNIR